MNYTIGVDECGTGACAGPICVAGVRAPSDWTLPGLNDSKALDRSTRQKLSEAILRCAKQGTISYHLVLREAQQIDQLGLGKCHKSSITEIINCLHQFDDTTIIDGKFGTQLLIENGLRLETTRNLRIEPKADTRYPTVMAASIIAKHHRDTLMIQYHDLFPHYDWEQNVGYIVPKHKQAIREYGLSELHRKSYRIKLD